MTITYLPASFGEAIAAIAEGKHVEFKMADRPETPWLAFTEDTWVRLADTPKYIWRIRAEVAPTDARDQLIEQLRAELGRVRIQCDLLRFDRAQMLRQMAELQAELQAARARGIRALRFFGG